MPWFRRKPKYVAPTHGDRLTSPPDPVEGTYSGTLVARKERTWAGCVIMPNEAERMPTVLLLQLGDRCAPLKWLPAEREMELIAVVQTRRDPRTPPSPIPEDPLLGPADAERLGAAVGDTVTVRGVAYPMYVTGTIMPIHIWGLYVRPAA